MPLPVPTTASAIRDDSMQVPRSSGLCGCGRPPYAHTRHRLIVSLGRHVPDGSELSEAHSSAWRATRGGPSGPGCSYEVRDATVETEIVPALGSHAYETGCGQHSGDGLGPVEVHEREHSPCIGCVVLGEESWDVALAPFGEQETDLHSGKVLNRLGCADFRRALCQAFGRQWHDRRRSLDRETRLELAACNLEGIFTDSYSDSSRSGF